MFFWMVSVLLRVTIAVIKHYDQKPVGEARVYLFYVSTSPFIIEGSQERNSNRPGTWRQEELMRKSYRGTVHWLAQPAAL